VTGEIVIEFDLPAEPLSLNNGDKGWQKRDYLMRKAEWGRAAYFAACQTFPRKGPTGRAMPPSTVHVSIPVINDRRRRDPINWVPTVKVIVDQLVRAGMWPDDTPEYVDQPVPSLRPVPRKELWKSKVYVRVVPRGEQSS
jgi:hypothetical protein